MKWAGALGEGGRCAPAGGGPVGGLTCLDDYTVFQGNIACYNTYGFVISGAASENINYNLSDRNVVLNFSWDIDGSGNREEDPLFVDAAGGSIAAMQTGTAPPRSGPRSAPTAPRRG